MWAAQVEIALAASDVDVARTASDELAETARIYESSGLQAAARQAQGAVLLAAGSPADAGGVLRSVCRLWQELGATYNAATTRVLLAQAYRALGDEDAAQLELDAACVVFGRFGAKLDTRRVGELQGRGSLPGGLTEREAEVLRLVASGKSNRDIATLLFISERTVHRHLSKHLHQARGHVSDGGHRVRLRARPDVIARWVELPNRSSMKMHRPTDAAPPRAAIRSS